MFTFRLLCKNVQFSRLTQNVIISFGNKSRNLIARLRLRPVCRRIRFSHRQFAVFIDLASVLRSIKLDESVRWSLVNQSITFAHGWSLLEMISRFSAHSLGNNVELVFSTMPTQTNAIFQNAHLRLLASFNMGGTIQFPS